MGFSDFLMAAVPALLSIVVPGFAIALPLLKKLKMGIPEALGIGFALGLVLPPSVLMLESLVGIQYSYTLFIINTLALTLLGIGLCIKEKVLPLEVKLEFKRDWVWFALLFLMVMSFYLRMQSAFPTNAGAYLYEFDPYYYTTITQFIVQNGTVPMYDDLAWYPNLSSHRAPPIAYYLGAEWYSIYNAGKPFDLYTLGFVQSFYPPVVAAAAVFFAFLLISEPYGHKLGLVAAGLFAFAPRLIETLAAWEQQETPWGVFGSFFFYAAYALVISRQDRRSAILAGIALAALTLGSKSDVQAYLVMAGYLGLQGLMDFVKGRQLSWKFLEINAIIVAFGLFAQVIMNMAYAGSWSIPTDPFALMGALYFYFALTAIWDKLHRKREWTIYEKVLLLPVYLIEQSKLLDMESDRMNYLVVLLVLGVIALLFTPLGPPVLGYVKGAAGQSLPGDPLANTVAEEGGTGNDFTNAMGPLGLPLKILFENNLLSGMAALLVFAIPFLAALVLAWKYDSKYSIYFAIVVLPVMWVGLGKIKFVLQLAAAMIIGFCAVLGGITLAIKELVKDKKSAALYENGIFAACAVLVLLTAWPALLVAAASMDASNYYESNGQMFMDCNKIGPSIQSSLFELSPGDKNRATGTAYYLYCSKIPQWWLDPMDWIRNNVAENDRVIHWWDYGHWTNFFGQRKTITRNDHQYPAEDLQMADLLVANTPAHAAQWMRDHKAKYLLLDQDLIGKWGALDYLSCVQDNETQFIPHQVGSSQCEGEHYFERVYFPVQPTQADLCNINAPFQMFRASSTVRGQDAYCVAQVTQNNQTQFVMAYESNGTINHGILMPQGTTAMGDGRDYVQAFVLYPPPGQGYDDRSNKFYDSVFYKGFFLGHIDGFVQVYPYEAEYAQFGPSIPVRIFKLKDEAATAPITPLTPAAPPAATTPPVEAPAQNATVNSSG